MKGSMSSHGYPIVRLTNGKTYTTYRHRILAETFIPNPDNKPIVDHKNRIKSDNRIDNLCWVTRTENARNISKRITPCSSPYLGVSWNKEKQNWWMNIQVIIDNKKYGPYLTDVEAAMARDQLIIKELSHFPLNFSPDGQPTEKQLREAKNVVINKKID